VAGCARARAQEFKAQTIDTPGVIERVLRLFHGSRELILFHESGVDSAFGSQSCNGF
jgi:hypothetical protein